jgi:predicted ATPase/DNA-binding CsgD family transcriptional regulator
MLEPRSAPGACQEARTQNVSEMPPVGTARTPVKARTRPTSQGNLPAAVTSFVGRRHEIAEVKRLLSTSRLVTLTGPGGVGKTRLALRAAGDLRRDFADGVWLVELAPLGDAGLLAQTVVAALGISDQSARPPAETLSEYLADKHPLLVLDNCEHLVDGCAVLVDALLRAAPRVRILATSRQSLGIAGERVMAVPSLSMPAMDGPLPPVAALATYEAVSLFVDRAEVASPEFTLTEGNARAVARICRMLDGIPLAIELATVRLRTLTVEQILERLEDRFRFLTAGSRAALPRQRALRALIDWSYELCTEPERILWARTSVFADEFDLQAAEAVCSGRGLPTGHVLEALDGLVDKSIVNVTGQEGRARYRMLDTVRAFGLEGLDASDERAATLGRHRDYYRRLAGQAQGQWFSANQVAWFQRLRREHNNLRAALEFCLTEPGEAAVGMALAADLWPAWIAGGRLSEGRHWLDRALAQALEPSPARATALWVAAWAAVLQEDVPAALPLLAECRALARQLGDLSALAYAEQIEGLAGLIQGDVQLGMTRLEQALADHRTAENQAGGAYTLFMLAAATSWAGDADRTIALCEEGLAVSEASGENWSRSWTMWVLGFELARRGEYERAEALARDTLQVKRHFEDRLGIGHCLELIAWAAAAHGRRERATRLLGAAQQIRRSIGEPLPPILVDPHARCEADLRGALGERGLTAGLRRGADLTFDEAVAFALEEQAPPAATEEEAPLTAREREVADLVARGMTNREIAGTLVISQRTAEGHVEHVLSKLGFTSRAQIAAWVAGRRKA